MIERPFSMPIFRKEVKIIPNEKLETVGEVYRIPISQLHPHPENPYGIRDDHDMLELTQSVRKFGVLCPAIARPRQGGGYELIAGHRRKEACERAGLDFMPVMVLKLDDNDAIIQLVDSNIQRENILPSERAKAYKLRMEAIKRKAGRPSKEQKNNSPNHSAAFRSDDTVGQGEGVSGDTVRNYISLLNLAPPLLEMVDKGTIALTPAYQLTHLAPDEQEMLLTTMDSEQATPSVSQAQRLRKLSQSGELNEDSMLQIMMEHKKPEKSNLSLPMDRLRKYFPRSYSPQRIEETIFKLLDAWMRKRQRDNSR